MAATVEGAFVLVDNASRVLAGIERQALKTDAALASVAASMDAIGTNAQLKRMDSAGQSIRNFGRETENASRKVRRAGTDIRRATDDVTRRMGILSRAGMAVVGVFTKINNLANPLRRGLRNLRDDMRPLEPAFKALAGGIGAVGGGIQGLATAFPPLVTAMALALPLVIALGGAVGALAVSLGAAVGGAAVVGAGLLGAFAVGLGSIVAIAKPAITQLRTYGRLVSGLNKAMSSGNKTAIRNYQKQLDAFDKTHPGIQGVYDGLKKIQDRWNRLSRPAQNNFFRLLNDGLRTANQLLPVVAGEVTKNVGAIERSFRTILGPSLTSPAFIDMLKNLGSIFRTITPGIMRGLVGFGQGFAEIVRTATPTLKGVGDWFAGAGQSFQRFFASRAGVDTVRAMLGAFKSWGELIGATGHLILATFQAAGPGTGVVRNWARSINQLADRIQRNPRLLTDFFSKSLRDAKGWVGLLGSMLSTLKDLVPLFDTLGKALGGIARTLGPTGIEALLGAYVGGKAIQGAVKGRTTGVRIIDKLFGSRNDGSSPTRPLFVRDVGPGGGGPGGSKPKPSPVPGGEGGPGRGGRYTGPGGSWEARPGGLANRFGRLATRSPLKAGGTIAAGIAAFANAANAQDTPANKLNALVQGADPTNALAGLFGLPGFTGLLLPGVKRTPSAPTLSQVNTAVTGVTPAMASTYRRFKDGYVVLPAHSTLSAPGAPQPGSAAYNRNAQAITATALLNQRVRQIGPGAAIAQTLAGAVPGVGGMLSGLVGTVAGAAHTPAIKRQFGALTSAVGAIFDSWKSRITKPVDNALSGVRQAVDSTGKHTVRSAADSTNSTVIAVTTGYAGMNTVVTGTLSSMGTNVGRGLGSIVDQTNAVLQQFGVPGLRGSFTTSAPKARRHAQGGRLPGPARGDHIPLFSRGGTLLGIADGGELVVNRHTEARINTKLAAYGTTLGREVAGENKRHTQAFAQGGRLPSGIFTASMFGGPGDRASSGATASGKINNDSLVGYAELSNPPGSLNFAALGGLPMGTRLNITYNNKTINAPKVDVGAGGPGIGGHIRAIDLTYGLARMLGFGGLGLVSLNGGGGAGGSPTIKQPMIHGPSGALLALGNAIMGKGTAAANKKIAKMIPAATIAGGGGATAGPGGVGTMDGRPVANWIIPILSWARAHGWGGSVTSGYRNPAQQLVAAEGYGLSHYGPGGPLASNHTKTAYPGGAVDVTDPPGLASVLRRYPGTPNLVWGGPVIGDYVHFSATGHQRGGRLPFGGWYGSGADFMATRPQIIGVGDKRERVTITPQGHATNAPRLHIGQITIQNHRPGDIRKQIEHEVSAAFATLARELDIQPMEDDEAVVV